MFYLKAKNPQGKWYPRSVTQGKPVSTKTIAKKLAQISTVSEADARDVLIVTYDATMVISIRIISLDDGFFHDFCASFNPFRCLIKVSKDVIR